MAGELAPGTSKKTNRLKNYPPIAAVVFALLLLAALPSALNLPQSNPTQTLEYAPVPPDEDRPPPPAGGSFSSLGLGSSSSLTGTESGLGGGGAGSLTGGGRTASTKRCVGNPPRQTEDPLSPPCVAYFEGDNGGATYAGVTREEIRVLIYSTITSQVGHWQGSQRSGPGTEYKDMNDPDTPDMWYKDRYLKTWQRYFNDRYQTYDRKVHLWAYWASFAGGGANPESRSAQAADNYTRIKPFAVTFDRTPTFLDSYQDVMGKRGVLIFTNTLGLSQQSLQKWPKLTWGFLPTDVEQARIFGSYLCEKVFPNPVSSLNGNGDVGKPRKYGLMYTSSAARADWRRVKDYMKTYVADNCGMQFDPKLERTYPINGSSTQDQDNVQSALEAMKTYQDQGVTTIIWPLGFETQFSKAAEKLGYFPEWIIAGDEINDGNWQGSFQAQGVFDRHALNITTTGRERPISISPACEEAYLQADPTIPRDGLDLAEACYFYPSLRQLFTGIQVAGPRLGPTPIDRGFRAIPKVASSSPFVQSCFYAPGDTSCVKDSQIVWWERNGDRNGAGETSGCWRMAQGGKRYLPGAWPAGNIDAPIGAGDPCNGHAGSL